MQNHQFMALYLISNLIYIKIERIKVLKYSRWTSANQHRNASLISNT